MLGHVFFIRGDITQLACDAWLLPTSRRITLTDTWKSRHPELMELRLLCNPSREWRSGDERVMPVTCWPKQKPMPWFVNVGGHEGKEAGWYVEGVRQFFDKVIPAVKSQGKRFLENRSKPLIALPLVGTGRGGGIKRAGEILSCLLPELYKAADEVDIALVLNNEQAYAAAVAERKKHDFVNVAWPTSLSEKWREKAKYLANLAAINELVLFIGAGVSASAGLPDWAGLIRKLAEESGVFRNCEESTEYIKEGFFNLDPKDQARVISQHLEDTGRTLGVEVAKLFAAHQYYSLSHAILAALPVKEVVTTNYDCLYEKASKDAQGVAPRVLPHDPENPGSRWILKLHGCVSCPEQIVLTRSDYLRYSDTRAALKGIVQALLITRHMLFVGFSLNDDNFHSIIDDVRKSIRNVNGETQHQLRQGHQFSTALGLARNPFVERLWKEDVDWVTFQSDEVTEQKEAARLLEIFLDYLASECATSAPYLLDNRFDGVLSEEEKKLREALLNFINGACTIDSIKETTVWHEIELFIQRLGGKVV